jgi:ABC-type multidrug transport system ATPase subunit
MMYARHVLMPNQVCETWFELRVRNWIVHLLSFRARNVTYAHVQVELESVIDEKVRTFSGGMKRRLSVAISVCVPNNLHVHVCM